MSEYGKLVRDGIPAKIRRNGETPITRTLRGDELEKAYLAKIIEEALEVQASGGTLEELANLKAVVDAFCKYKGIHPGDIADAETKKSQALGRFDEGIYLIDVDSKASSDKSW